MKIKKVDYQIDMHHLHNFGFNQHFWLGRVMEYGMVAELRHRRSCRMVFEAACSMEIEL